MHYYHSGVDFTCDHDLTCTVAQCAYVKIGSNLIAAHVSQSASHPVIAKIQAGKQTCKFLIKSFVDYFASCNYVFL